MSDDRWTLPIAPDRDVFPCCECCTDPCELAAVGHPDPCADGCNHTPDATPEVPDA